MAPLELVANCPCLRVHPSIQFLPLVSSHQQHFSTFQRSQTRRHPDQKPEPPQLAPFDPQEQRLQSELPPDLAGSVTLSFRSLPTALDHRRGSEPRQLSSFFTTTVRYRACITRDTGPSPTPGDLVHENQGQDRRQRQPWRSPTPTERTLDLILRTQTQLSQHSYRD